MSILETIIESRKKNLPSEKSLRGISIEKSTRDFRGAIERKESDRVHLIAELKRKSPSRGEINPDVTVEEALRFYSPYASALSILTEPEFFGGSLEDLKKADGLTQVPILRKDFIIDPIQVKEARYFGADSYLLIVAALSKNQLEELIEAGREYDMTPLIEVHQETELEFALDGKARILGINNRDLNDLSIDLQTTARLTERIPSEMKGELVIVSESGLHSKADIDALPQETDAVLIGTSFMSADDPAAAIKSIFSQ